MIRGSKASSREQGKVVSPEGDKNDTEQKESGDTVAGLRCRLDWGRKGCSAEKRQNGEN
jgi:hypothetical protein